GSSITCARSTGPRWRRRSASHPSRPTRSGGSACAPRATSSTSRRSRASAAAAATGRRRGSPRTSRWTRSWRSSARSSRIPPRALTPSGVILVDKPAGPSSFAVVAQIRRRTGARTGHAGTLDPFATGLLLVLSGAATKLAPRFVGLDKRYLTEIDLTGRTATGDPEGEPVEEREPPEQGELEEALDGLRG